MRGERPVLFGEVSYRDRRLSRFETAELGSLKALVRAQGCHTAMCFPQHMGTWASAPGHLHLMKDDPSYDDWLIFRFPITRLLLAIQSSRGV